MIVNFFQSCILLRMYLHNISSVILLCSHSVWGETSLKSPGKQIISMDHLCPWTCCPLERAPVLVWDFSSIEAWIDGITEISSIYTCCSNPNRSSSPFSFFVLVSFLCHWGPMQKVDITSPALWTLGCVYLVFLSAISVFTLCKLPHVLHTYRPSKGLQTPLQEEMDHTGWKDVLFCVLLVLNKDWENFIGVTGYSYHPLNEWPNMMSSPPCNLK